MQFINERKQYFEGFLAANLHSYMMDVGYKHFSANGITSFIFMTKCNPIECAYDVIKANVVAQHR